MRQFSYTYILVSEVSPARHYVGLTDDLKDRLRRHNAGEVALRDL
jgi:predicted GIY-YIG superfamily endonuclease